MGNKNNEVINELLAIDQAMLAELLRFNPEKLTEEQMTEAWNKTVWHKIILNRIEQLREPKMIIE